MSFFFHIQIWFLSTVKTNEDVKHECKGKSVFFRPSTIFRPIHMISAYFVWKSGKWHTIVACRKLVLFPYISTNCCKDLYKTPLFGIFLEVLSEIHSEIDGKSRSWELLQEFVKKFFSKALWFSSLNACRSSWLSKNSYRNHSKFFRGLTSNCT